MLIRDWSADVVSSVPLHHQAREKGSEERQLRPDVEQAAKGGFLDIGGRGGRIAGVAGRQRLEDHRVGKRKDPEFYVAVSIRQLVIAFAHLGPAALFDPLGEVEGGDHRALDLGCDAEQAEREPLRPIQVRVRRRVAPARLAIGADRSEESRGGKAWVSTGRSRWAT